MAVEASHESAVDVFEEAAALGVGLGLIVLVLFPLALPAIALTLLLALPIVPVALAASLLAAPMVLIRRLTRRGPEEPQRADDSRSERERRPQRR